MRPDAVGLGGFDSHTLPPPHLMPNMTFRPESRRATRETGAARRAGSLPLAVLVVLLTVGGTTASAQQRDSAQAGVRPPQPRAAQPRPDSLRPPVSPRRAFLYSFLVPGYGQAVLDRPLAGALFFGVEIASIVLANKAAYDLRYARAHARDSIVAAYDYNTDGTIKTDPASGRPVVLRYERNRYAGDRVAARRRHLEDYYALLAANHLLAGAEAFVSAQLWDLPTRVSIRALPFGTAVAATIRW